MKKVLFLLFIFTIMIIMTNISSSIYAYNINTGTGEPVVRYVKDVNGDKICFEVVVKTATTSTKYWTTGWIISINNFKIIYKYPEIPHFDFTFYMRDIEEEFKRQYGESSSTYNSIKNILYETGGTISFDAIKTVEKGGVNQGSIVNNPIYGRSDSYNYTGRVYTTLSGIQNAESWSSTVRNVDLPKYFGISYNFSKQPSVNGKFTIKYLDADGKSISADRVQTCIFGTHSSYKYTGNIGNITDYNFKGWKIYDNKKNVVKSGSSSSYECILTRNLPEAVMEVTYESKIPVPDLYVSSISPLEYKERTKVITIVTVGNTGKTDFGPNNTVNVRLKINNTVYMRAVDMGAGMEIIVPFVWTTPAAGTVSMEAEINYDIKHNENNYNNNKISKQAQIKPYRVEPITNTPKVNIIPLPKINDNNYIEWKEWRFMRYGSDGKPIYEQKTFWIRLNITATSDVSNLKSGYGFFLDVSTNVTTNYDKPEFVISPQRTQVYTPETQFKSFFELDIRSINSNFSTSWFIPVNQSSVYKYRRHYVPIWFPDRINYEMNIAAIDSYCPGGSLNSTATPRIFINGNMYQDDTNGGFR